MFTHFTKQEPDSAFVRRAANDDSVETGKKRFRRWLESVVRRRQQRRMRRDLERLDDRTLADIGIHRNDIPLVVEGFDDRELRMVPVAEPVRAPKTPSGLRKAA